MSLFDRLYGYDDFIGSGIDKKPVNDEDKHYDPDGVFKIEEELDFDDDDAW